MTSIHEIDRLCRQSLEQAQARRLEQRQAIENAKWMFSLALILLVMALVFLVPR